MEIWLDTSNVDVVAFAHQLGLLHGVTTNPTILAGAKLSLQHLIDKLLEVQTGPVAVQVLSDDVEEMKRQAGVLNKISQRIVIKVPVTKNGLQVIHALNQEGIQTLATAIFELPQALFALKAGASYLAPYLGRIADTGNDPIQLLSKIQSMKLHYGFKGKIMAASIRDIPTAMKCVEIGISAVTLYEKVFAELIQEPVAVSNALKKFSEDWAQLPHLL